MIKWLTIPDETKRNAYEQIAEKTGMSAFAVEKDWWVVQTLSTVFGMQAGPALLFKGGTSLSKAWQLIERFSEDIDLAIDRDFLGFPGNLSKNQRTYLRQAAGDYTAGPFLAELKHKFAEQGIENTAIHLVDVKNSDQDPRIIEIYYPNVIPAPGYLEPKVQIEIGCRSLREPFSNQSFGSLIDEHYADKDFVKPFIQIPVVNPERTFLEKIFLLHEEFQRPPQKVRVERLSRHLYDVIKLSQTTFKDQALADIELYSTIVEHRHKYARVGGVNYNLHQPQTINPIPRPDFIEAWRDDYNIMVERMIYEENPPSFDEIISDLTTLKESINQLPWQFPMHFPKPDSSFQTPHS